MASAEIDAWMTILTGRGWKTEFGLEDTNAVGTSDLVLDGVIREATSMESVEEDCEVGV